MGLLIRQYGALILSILTGIGVIGLIAFCMFGGSGKRSSVGAQIEQKEASLKEEKGAGQVEAEKVMKTEVPGLRTAEGIRRGVIYKSEELIHADSGDRANIRLLRTYKLNGEDTSGNVIQSDGSACFPDSGVYRVRFFIEEEEGAFGTMEVYLGVGT